MKRRYFGVRGRTWIVVLTLAALVAGASLIPGAKDNAIAQSPAVSASGNADGATSYARSLSKAFREAAQKVLPAVVLIRNVPIAREQATSQEEGPDISADDNPFGDMLPPEFRHFFKDMPRMPRGFPRGSPHGEMGGIGSGVIIDPSGVILTNNHVIDGGGKVMIRLHDGREFEGTDIKTDPKTDLAIVRIKGAGALPAAKLANSDDAQVGDWVLAIGGPFGQEGTVTAGIVSAKGRDLNIAPRENFIQTDAAINSGNSGGPLVDLDGNVVGINTAISSRGGGNLGIGFAVPSKLAKWVSRQLIAQGTVKRAYLGVAIQRISHDLGKQFGVKARHGVVVADVQPNTPAAAAGVKAGDVIIAFSGKAVSSPQELQLVVEQSPIGGSQPLTVLRDGKRMTLNVTAREQPADYGLARGELMAPGKEGTVRDQKMGIEVANLTADVAEKLGVKSGEGVVITNIRKGGPAEMAGLQSGMVIVQVNRKPVKTVDEFRAAMAKESLAKGVLLLVRSGQGTQYVVIQAS